MEPSPLVPHLVLAVPWQHCAMHISAEPVSTATKINPVGVQPGRDIWELTVLE